MRDFGHRIGSAVISLFSRLKKQMCLSRHIDSWKEINGDGLLLIVANHDFAKHHGSIVNSNVFKKRRKNHLQDRKYTLQIYWHPESTLRFKKIRPRQELLGSNGRVDDIVELPIRLIRKPHD